MCPPSSACRIVCTSLCAIALDTQLYGPPYCYCYIAIATADTLLQYCDTWSPSYYPTSNLRAHAIEHWYLFSLSICYLSTRPSNHTPCACAALRLLSVSHEEVKRQGYIVIEPRRRFRWFQQQRCVRHGRRLAVANDTTQVRECTLDHG